MPIIDHFKPPGFATDLTPENQTQWSNFLSTNYFERSKKGSSDENDGPRKQFFDPTVDEVDSLPKEEIITWSAFPRQVAVSSTGDLQRWKKADSTRAVQDEYCEWSVHRDTNGRILWIDFTSEGPEYWKVMAQLQPETVVELYRKHIAIDIDQHDLFPAGQYEPLNRWNNSTSNGAMHLIQGANTLGAEIELAGGATIVRRRNGELVSNEQDLILCSGYGAPKRHSDPHIGAEINGLAREGRLITLADPVGLFIQGCDFSGFTLPTHNVTAAQCWHIVRGTQERPLRVRFAPPDGENFTVSDVQVDGKAIAFGGQIADKISIALAGWATPSTNHLSITDGCRKVSASPLAAVAAAAPAGALATRR